MVLAESMSSSRRSVVKNAAWQPFSHIRRRRWQAIAGLCQVCDTRHAMVLSDRNFWPESGAAPGDPLK
jgi:hypothetical protein